MTSPLRRALLDWYDRHARALPWRVGPADRAAGVKPDPYRVWLSEIMLQQTTVPHAAPYFLDFTRRWPTVTDLAHAEDGAVMAAWAGLGYYARARNLLACARALADRRGGVFPNSEEGLLTLPGVGAYTAAAVAAIAFDRAANVVDGNVERVISRLYAVQAPLPGSKPKLKALASALVTDERPGDWAQALMDLGAHDREGQGEVGEDMLDLARGPPVGGEGRTGLRRGRLPAAGGQGKHAAEQPFWLAADQADLRSLQSQVGDARPARAVGLSVLARIGLWRAFGLGGAGKGDGAALAQRRLGSADGGAEVHQGLGPVAGALIGDQC